MLIAIAEEHPVILVVDDLHFADDVSLAVLHLIIRRARARAIMVVLVARPGELLHSSQAVRLLKSNPSLGILEVEVLPLNMDESREMLHSLTDPSEPQPTLAEQRALLRAAAGYPMVLELLVQDWKASGAQSLALSVNAMTAEFGTKGPAQAAYHQILDRITLSLDGTAQSVLNLASILGRRLNDLGMYGIVDLSAGQTMAGMAELVNRRVLRDGAQGLEFVNDLVRAAVYIGVPQTIRRVLHGNIADRFIDKHNRGESDLGLEIAWHCIRAGRGAEATPHLLSGAREAMRRGALESAERGLATALSHLHGSERADAVMLLADILQEQGRWLESLALLDSQAGTDDNVNQDWKTVLTINARFHLYPITVKETIDQILALVKVIRECDRTAPRIAAALAATTLGGNSRDQSHAQVVLDSLPLIPIRQLCQEDLSRLSLARARLMFQLHDRPASRHEIETALAVLDSSKAVNTTAAQFQLGLGAMSCMDGDYRKALIHLEKAYAVAERLGNDTLRSAIAVNLSLVHCRLGSYDTQLQWAHESLSLGCAHFNNYHAVLATYCGALASIFKGGHMQAREFISAANSRVAGGLPQWALQAWALYRADLHRLLGDEEESRVAALAATRGSNARLHSPSFAGAYCRWTASLATSTEALRSASDMVRSFVVQLSAYDALDRAEILASFVFLQRKLGELTDQIETLLFDHLQTLPPAVTDQLARLRILG
jgi:tetratricopeptide (TPR) repeat protein